MYLHNKFIILRIIIYHYADIGETTAPATPPNLCIIMSNLTFGRREKIFGVFFASRGQQKSVAGPNLFFFLLKLF